MEGRAKAVEHELELALFTAWQTARLSQFHGGKLKPLTALLRELKRGQPRQRRTQSREERVAALRAIMATMGPAQKRPETPTAGQS